MPPKTTCASAQNVPPLKRPRTYCRPFLASRRLRASRGVSELHVARRPALAHRVEAVFAAGEGDGGQRGLLERGGPPPSPDEQGTTGFRILRERLVTFLRTPVAGGLETSTMTFVAGIGGQRLACHRGT